MATSIKVKEWLRRLGIDASHDERVEIDREIERRTGKYCDDGIVELTEQQFMGLVSEVKQRKKRGRPEILAEALA